MVLINGSDERAGRRVGESLDRLVLESHLAVQH